MPSDIFSTSYRLKKKFKDVAGFLLYGREPTNPNHIGFYAQAASFLTNGALFLFGAYAFEESYSSAYSVDSRFILPSLVAASAAIGIWASTPDEFGEQISIAHICRGNFLRSTLLSAGIAAAGIQSVVGTAEPRLRDRQNYPTYRAAACLAANGQITRDSDQDFTLPDGRNVTIRIAAANPVAIMVYADAGYAPALGYKKPGQFHDRFYIAPDTSCRPEVSPRRTSQPVP